MSIFGRWSPGSRTAHSHVPGGGGRGAQINKVYQQADYVGSLVVEGRAPAGTAERGECKGGDGAVRRHVPDRRGQSGTLETLLPKTHKLFLVRQGQGIVASGDWDRVQEVVGDLLEETDLYPARYRVRAFPSDEQLAAIGNEMK